MGGHLPRNTHSLQQPNKSATPPPKGPNCGIRPHRACPSVDQAGLVVGVADSVAPTPIYGEGSKRWRERPLGGTGRHEIFRSGGSCSTIGNGATSGGKILRRSCDRRRGSGYTDRSIDPRSGGTVIRVTTLSVASPRPLPSSPLRVCVRDTPRFFVTGSGSTQIAFPADFEADLTAVLLSPVTRATGTGSPAAAATIKLPNRLLHRPQMDTRIKRNPALAYLDPSYQ